MGNASGERLVGASRIAGDLDDHRLSFARASGAAFELHVTACGGDARVVGLDVEVAPDPAQNAGQLGAAALVEI